MKRFVKHEALDNILWVLHMFQAGQLLERCSNIFMI